MIYYIYKQTLPNCPRCVWLRRSCVRCRQLSIQSQRFFLSRERCNSHDGCSTTTPRRYYYYLFDLTENGDKNESKTERFREVRLAKANFVQSSCFFSSCLSSEIHSSSSSYSHSHVPFLFHVAIRERARNVQRNTVRYDDEPCKGRVFAVSQSGADFGSCLRAHPHNDIAT
jgi:hypothetical protein